MVPDFSSYLGDERERAETLNGDHRSMCKYASIQDLNYQRVAAELRTVYTTLVSKSLEKYQSTPVAKTSITSEDQSITFIIVLTLYYCLIELEW